MVNAKHTLDEMKQLGDEKDKRLAEFERAYYRLSVGNKALLFSESSKDQSCNVRYRGFER